MWKRKNLGFLLLLLFVAFGICWQTAQAEETKTCMVYFDSQGGSTINPRTGIVYNTVIGTLPVPTREGFTFLGWYTDVNYTNKVYETTRVTNDMVVFAKWEEKLVVSITATYQDKTAIVGQLLDIKKVTVQATYSDNTKKTLAPSEYTIVDMKVASYGTNVFIVEAGIATDIFVVQGIDEPTYSVNFFSNGGSYVPSITGIKAEQTISMPAEPNRKDYEFKGWYLDNGTFKEKFTSEYKITKSIIVFAKWEKLEVIVEKPEYNLNTTELQLKVNQQKSLYIASYDPYMEVEYTSKNSKIATVSSEGIVEGKKKGTTTIYVVTPDGEILKCKVIVNGIQAKSIKLNAASKTLNVGKTFQIKTTFSPSTVSTKKLTYKSSKNSVAKVSSKGKITALKKGTCTITVKTTDGSKLTKKIKITVK